MDGIKKNGGGDPHFKIERLLRLREGIAPFTENLTRNIHRILLFLVIAFFIVQIFAGALTIFRGKYPLPYKHSGFAGSPREKITESGNLRHRRSGVPDEPGKITDDAVFQDPRKSHFSFLTR
jgi:hypothetical protein